MNTVTRLSLVFILSLSTIFFCAPVSFGAPPILNYQGTLTNDQGTPVTGAVPMVFRIYATMDATPAQALWNSGTVNVAVVNGAFAIDLGDNSTAPPQPVLSAGIFSNDTRYLGVTVNGQELVPRKRLASVPYAMSAGVPKGSIIMWSGAVDNIPQGWALCNGEDGTPDLRDRFLIGAGNSYAAQATGGEAAHTLTVEELPSHDHTITDNTGSHTHTVSDPGHRHAIGGNDGGSGQNARIDMNRAILTNTDSAQTGISIPISGGHNHVVNSKGGGVAHNNLPPYYAICFIMKL